ncbi:MAG: hypothetical protein A2033_16040 [Bacteroidetes bacterium GWA2_31_9]|nr:MAG: hypothetical protein A2033_16040 [Bacteroidetes bacterium GWA2_31_9]
MKLITKELENTFKKTGRQENVPDPFVIAKFFNPCGSQTWYATEYDPESKTCFGYVTGMGYDEWGYFSIAELENIKVPPFNLAIERDIYFVKQPISKLVPALAKSKTNEDIEPEIHDKQTCENDIRLNELKVLQTNKDKSINNLER